MTESDLKELFSKIELVLERVLTTEETKMLLGISTLGFGEDALLLAAKEAKGKDRWKTARKMESLLFKWHESGWHTIDEIRVGDAEVRIKPILQIKDRPLTPAEQKYVESWIKMGFEDKAISMAYERTCLNTGNLNWAYMNKILLRWHDSGVHTVEEVRSAAAPRKTEENPQIKKLEAENARLKDQVIELQTALIKEQERVRQLMEENNELRR